MNDIVPLQRDLSCEHALVCMSMCGDMCCVSFLTLFHVFARVFLCSCKFVDFRTFPQSPITFYQNSTSGAECMSFQVGVTYVYTGESNTRTHML